MLSKIKNTIRNIIEKTGVNPWPLRYILNYPVSLYYYGKNVHCPCCNGNFRKFLKAGINNRPNAICPRCWSAERTRLLYLYLKDKTVLFFNKTQKIKLLHIAPEYIITKLLNNVSNIEYISADLSSSIAMLKMDITKIDLPDNTFDAIIAVHVLEHIQDDLIAMKELFRVLKPSGWAILQVPIDIHREKTYEVSDIVSPEERQLVYGQADHCRIYGLDYKNRLGKAGFIVEVDKYVSTISDELIKKYGLKVEENIYMCHNHKLKLNMVGDNENQ